MSLLPGDVFAGFTIERELGAGGMGVVYLARHPRLPRRVALKLLRTDLGADPSFVGRFRREAETVARLDHPNIVAIDDSGAEDGRLWISMRFIDGTTASGALADYPAGMPPERAVHIVEKVAAALDFAHRHHIIHRDVKPANILLTEDGDEEERVFLTDFGVAKAMGEIEAQATSLTSAGDVVATLDYAAPEQIEGKQLDGRCDVYALGCVLYKLLTGGIPYPGDTLGAKIYARMHRPPPAPSAVVVNLPPAFDGVVATALALEPGARYQTCRALAVAARAAIGSWPTGQTTTERVGPADLVPTQVMGGQGARLAGGRPTGPSTSPSMPSLPGTGPGHAHTGADSLPAGLAQFLRPDPGPGGSGQTPGGTTPAGPSPIPAGPSPTPSSPRSGNEPPIDHGRRRRRQRSLLAIGAVLLVAVVVVGVGLLQRPSIGGNASPLAQTSARSTPKAVTSSGPTAATTNSAPSTTATNAVTNAAVTRTSAPVTSRSATDQTATGHTAAGGPPPVAGLPHSAPLPASTIVASRDDNNTFRLYPVDAVTGKIGPAIIPPAAGPQNPLISPDRGSIIYLQGDDSGNTIRTAAADGTGSRVLFDRPEGCEQIARPAWNPANTQQLAISCAPKTGPRTIQIVDLSGNVLRTLPDSPGLYRSDDLSFSPDGKQVTFWGSVTATAADGRLYLQSTDGLGLPKAITPDGSRDADPDFSPDGSRIAFRRVVGSYAQIFTALTDGSDPQMLTTTASQSQGPVWSPDARQIAFKSNQGQKNAADYELWVLEVAAPHDPHVVVAGDAGSMVASPAWGNR